MKIKKLMITAIMILSTAISFATPATNELLKKVDDVMELKTDIKAKVTITQQKVNEGIKIMDVTYYRRDSDDSFLMVLNAPSTEKGNGYLKVGDNFWVYKKNTRTFQHINRDESISGSDAKSGDFEKKKLSEQYKPSLDKAGNEIISEEILGKIPVYKFEILAKANDIQYPKKVYWIRKDNFLPLKMQSYSISGTLMESNYFIKYAQVDGISIAVKMMIVDEFEKGNKSEVEMSGISTAKIENEIFTKAYLENLSK